MNFQKIISHRELEILKLICVGQKSNEIAEQIFISCYTVKDHRKSLLQKLEAKNVAHMVHLCHQQQLL